MNGATRVTAQAFVELRADDPEAASALAVARAYLDAARDLQSLRRMRVFELRGALPEREALAELLHRSTQFYNPAKERCTVRTAAGDSAPVAPGEWLVLVTEAGGERRPAAERWWRHETGRAAEVREGVVWALGFRDRDGARARAEDLALVRDRRHGLFCNPQFQQWRLEDGDPPLPWLGARRAAGRGRRAS